MQDLLGTIINTSIDSRIFSNLTSYFYVYDLLAGLQAMLTVIFPKTVGSGAFQIDAYSATGWFGMICGIFIATLYLPFFFKVGFI